MHDSKYYFINNTNKLRLLVRSAFLAKKDQQNDVFRHSHIEIYRCGFLLVHYIKSEILLVVSVGSNNFSLSGIWRLSTPLRSVIYYVHYTKFQFMSQSLAVI